jgi:hypothetical protein
MIHLCCYLKASVAARISDGRKMDFDSDGSQEMITDDEAKQEIRARLFGR